MVQGSSLVVAICVCTAKEHVSYHLHALHYHLILTRQQQLRPAQDTSEETRKIQDPELPDELLDPELRDELSEAYKSHREKAECDWIPLQMDGVGKFRDLELRKDGQPSTKVGLMSPGACHRPNSDEFASAIACAFFVPFLKIRFM